MVYRSYYRPCIIYEVFINSLNYVIVGIDPLTKDHQYNLKGLLGPLKSKCLPLFSSFTHSWDGFHLLEFLDPHWVFYNIYIYNTQ